jgi:outer membrane protein OmpA-like peptidoglycan-associated protein
MKKMSLLALVLIVGLPGCRNKQETAQSVKKYIDTERAIKNVKVDTDDDDADADDIDVDLAGKKDADDADDEYDDEYDDEDDMFDFDDDKEDGDDDEDDVDILLAGEEDDEEDDEGKSSSVTWIDAQADDEFKKLYFTFNHYGINASQKEALSYNVEQVKQLIEESGSTQLTLLIEGHACQEGAPAYNVGLSEKRAKSVADLFVAAGVNRSVIKVVGRGQEYPEVVNGKVINGSRTERALNRRVELRVIYT